MSAVSVLVTDGEQRSALAAVRALGRAGYRVVVTSASGRSLAGASRYAGRELAVGDALTSPAGARERLAEVARREQVQVLFPMTEAAMLAVLDDPAAFPGVRVPGPDLARFRAISDKALVLERAAAEGIGVPRQLRADSRGVARDSASQLTWPVVLKPARSVAGGLQLRALHADGPEQLRARLESLPDAAFPLLIQQRVVGPGVGVFLLLWDGAVVARFIHRRLREKPPAGGVSVYRESVAPDTALFERSRRLLERFEWQGVAMIEYKVDAATGTPYLMEINGRLWGSLKLAVDAGVDFPVLLARLAMGESPAPVLDYQAGVRLRWEWGEVDHLLARLRRSDRALALPPGFPGRWRTAWDVLRPHGRGDRREVLRLEDPRPFLRESWNWVRRR